MRTRADEAGEGLRKVEATACKNEEEWGSFSKEYLTLLHVAVDRRSGGNVTIRAHRENLAATNPQAAAGLATVGSGEKQSGYEEVVPAVALDDLFDDAGIQDIELLHMCPQVHQFPLRVGPDGQMRGSDERLMMVALVACCIRFTTSKVHCPIR